MRLLKQGKNRETQAIVPQEFLPFDGRDGREERRLDMMLGKHRAGISVVVVLGIVESDGEQRARRVLLTKVSLMLSYERAAFKVVRKVG